MGPILGTTTVGCFGCFGIGRPPPCRLNPGAIVFRSGTPVDFTLTRAPEHVRNFGPAPHPRHRLWRLSHCPQLRSPAPSLRGRGAIALGSLDCRSHSRRPLLASYAVAH